MRNHIDLINEAFDEDSYAREAKIEKLIRYAFEKIKLEINYTNHSVYYEDDTREASVRLETPADGFSLKHLNALADTGLSDDFKVNTSDGALVVTFIVSEQLDDAILPA